MEKTVIFWLLLVILGVRAPPSRKSGCRKAAPNVVLKIREDNLIDLTHEFNENTPFLHPIPFGFELKTLFSGYVYRPEKYFYSSKTFNQPEHLGTHMDAPRHFSETGITAEKFSLSNMIGPGVLINMKQNGERFPHDSLVEIDHILNWENNNGGRIRSGSIVLLYTGNGDVYGDREAYFGTNMTGPDSVSQVQFPGLSPQAAAWLISNRCIAAVGIDTPSIDFAQTTNYESHQILNGANISIFENVGNLREVEEQGKSFKVVAFPQKISGGTGAPLRIIAVID